MSWLFFVSYFERIEIFFFHRKNQLKKIKIQLSLNSMGCLQLGYYEHNRVRAHERTRSGEANMVLCWLSVDPLAERGPQYSPYSFCFDNPMHFTDPDGRWPWPTWNNVKQYYSGMWQGAKETYKATGHAIAHPIETAKRIYNAPAQKKDIADVIGSNFGFASPGVTSAIRSTLQALSGDYKGAGKTNGATLADASIQGATLVVGAVAGKGLSLLTKGATAETTSLFRAVSSAELSDIGAGGLKTVQGGYETSKLFTTTAENAAQFGKNNFAFDGIPNTIIEAKVPQSVMSTATSFTADGMPAVAVPAEQLQNIKTIIPSTSSPIVK
jgi:hypothetical protein